MISCSTLILLLSHTAYLEIYELIIGKDEKSQWKGINRSNDQI